MWDLFVSVPDHCLSFLLWVYFKLARNWCKYATEEICPIMKESLLNKILLLTSALYRNG